MGYLEWTVVVWAALGIGLIIFDRGLSWESRNPWGSFAFYVILLLSPPGWIIYGLVVASKSFFVWVIGLAGFQLPEPKVSPPPERPPPLGTRCATPYFGDDGVCRIPPGTVDAWRRHEEKYVAWIEAHPSPEQEWLETAERVKARLARERAEGSCHVDAMDFTTKAKATPKHAR